MRKLVIDASGRVWSRKTGTATGLFVPLTAPFNTTFIKEMRPAYWLEAATPKLLVRLAYQMSDDGNDWSTTPTAVGSYSATTGWTYSDGASTSVTTDQRLFVRFGFQAANDTGSSDIEQGVARLSLEVKPVVGRTLAVDGAKVFTDGSQSNIFHPLLGPALLEDVGEHRASLRLFAPSGATDVTVQPAYQVSNDGITWYNGVTSGSANSFTTMGSSRSSVGTDYATTFTTFAPDEKKRFVRWGVAAKNATAGTTVEAGQVSLRVDYRRTT